MDRQSDDSSRRADSDSHPENWTDHEANDPPNYVSGSPPKSMEQPNKNEGSERRSRLFARDRGTPGSNKSKKHSLSVDLKPSADLNNTEVIVDNINISFISVTLRESFILNPLMPFQYGISYFFLNAFSNIYNFFINKDIFLVPLCSLLFVDSIENNMFIFRLKITCSFLWKL